MFSDSTAGGASRPEPAGRVRLTVEPDVQFTVHPGPNAVPFAPFALPRVPLSLLGWCGTLAGLFQAAHGRCIGCLLTLDPAAQRWLTPVIPPQVCEPNRATIDVGQTAQRDLPDPRSVIGGSYQRTASLAAVDVPRIVPAFDGLHVIDRVTTVVPPPAGDQDDDGEITSHCFLRAGGELRPIGAEYVVLDDWVALLRRHADRFSFD